MMKSMRFDTKTVFTALLATLLSACGGGGGGGSGAAIPSTPAVINGTLLSNTSVAPKAEVEAATIANDTAQPSGIIISNPTGFFASLADNQVVMLPPSGVKRLPFGYTGVVQRLPNGDIRLRAANIDEAFQKLQYSVDTAQNAAMVGLITPKGASLNLNGNTKQGTMTGLNIVSQVAYSGAGINVDLSVSHGITVAGIPVTLSGTVSLKDLSYQGVIDYDITQYPKTGGVNRLYSKISGTTKANLRLTTAEKVQFAPADLFPKSTNASYYWDEGLSVSGPNLGIFSTDTYFKLSGLDKSDRAGLIPLGGIVFSPTGGAISFTGQPNLITQSLASTSVIVWIYIDIDGSVKMTSDFTLLDFDSGPWSLGMEITNVNDALQANPIRTASAPALSSGYSGGLDATQNFGLVAAADLIVAGVRPATVKSELLGVTGSAKIEVNAASAFSWLPTPQWNLKGSQLCAVVGASVYSDLRLKTALSATLLGWNLVDFHQEAGPYTTQHLSYNNVYAQGCPSNIELTATSVTEDPKISQTCTVGGSTIACDLYCASPYKVGDVTTVPAMFIISNFASDGPALFSNRPAATNTFTFSGSYTASTSRVALQTPSPIQTIPQGAITYYSSTSDTFNGTADSSTGDIPGTLTSTVTTGWSYDSQVVSCSTRFSARSTIDFPIDRP